MNTDINNNHQLPEPIQSYQDAGDFTDTNSISGNMTDLSTDFMNDKDIWEGLLTDAGFWMSEGKFLSDNTFLY